MGEPVVLAAASSLNQDALAMVFDEYMLAVYKYLLYLNISSQKADQSTGDVFVWLLDKFAEGKGPRKILRSDSLSLCCGR